MSDATYCANLVLVGIDSTWDIEVAISLCGNYWYPVSFRDAEDVMFDSSSPNWNLVVRDFYKHRDTVDAIYDWIEEG